MRAPLLAALVGLGLAVTAAPTGAAATCKPVPFTPNSDDVAAEIRVARVSCRFARRFIRDSEGRPPRQFRGFRCTRRHVEPQGLSYTRYRCVRGERVIRWNRY